MRTLIVYGTTYGCTEKCAFKLTGHIKNDVSLINLEGKKEFDVADYEIVIIGGSIRLGRMNRSVSNFCKKNLNELLKKRIGLFICCMNEIEQAKEYLDAAFPRELQSQAIAKGYFGGELNLEEMTTFERSLLKSVIHIDESISLIKEDSIKDFAQIISRGK